MKIWRSFAGGDVGRLGRRLLGAMLAASLLWAARPAFAETRIALVIGNGSYKALPQLANPPNDARDVAEALGSLGFQVTLAVDADLARMRGLIADFAKSAATSDVSLLYYGGHGMQVASQNFLIPVDARLQAVDDVEKRTIHYADVEDTLAKGGGIHLVFLDACRTNPIKTAGAASISAGLARVEKKPGFLTIFATTPDTVAFDGAGRNSPFAQALLDHIATPGLDVSSMMIAVRNDVIASSGALQIPTEFSLLTRQFYFAGDAAAEASPEAALWRLAAGQRDPGLLAIYLDKYPKGAHAEDARSLLGGPAPPTPPKPRDLGDDLWRLALSSRERALVDLYLARYLDGAHAAAADALRASLEAAASAAKDPGVVCEQLATLPSDATANAPGVDIGTLVLHAGQAVDACRRATSAYPDRVHYVELLARATWAAGRPEESIALHRKAADAGDARAMVSLAFLMETGDHVPKDVRGAHALYEKAAARGNVDAAIDLGYALAKGDGVEKNIPRAFQLFRQASRSGSAVATYDLAKLIDNGAGGELSEAITLYKQAAGMGFPKAHLGAAILLDQGRGIARNPAAAAEELLECVRADARECLTTLTSPTQTRSPDTIKALQSRLRTAGYYAGPIDGRSGPPLGPALEQWRLLGPT